MYSTNKFLIFLCLINCVFGSDLRVVPTLNSSSSEESAPVRYANHDRIVPHIDLSPLGVHHDPIGNEIDGDTKRQEKFPPIVDSNEDVKLTALNDSSEELDPKTHYPTPRARIQEDIEIKSNTEIPTPRPRIQTSKEKDSSLPASERSVRSSLEDDENIVRDDSKPFALVYHSKPIELDAESTKLLDGDIAEGQPEEILVIQDVSSTEEDSASFDDKQKEVSDEEIQRYIDEIDKEFKEKNPQQPEVKDKIVDASGLRKYIVKGAESIKPDRSRREATNSKTAKSKIPSFGDEKISNVHTESGGLSYNVGFDNAKAPKPSLSSSPRHKREANKPIVPQNQPPSTNNNKNQLPPMKNDKAQVSPLNNNDKNDKIPSFDDEKISNVHTEAGGLSYNVGFDDAKGPKPTLNSTPRHKRDARPIQTFDHSRELTKSPLEKDAWFKPVAENTDLNEKSSEELTLPDKQLPKTPFYQHYDENQKTFDEILHKSMKDHEKQIPSNNENKDVYTQEVQRLPHKGPTLKNPGPGFMVDPPENIESTENSTSSESDEEIGLIVIEKTVVLEDDENRTQNLFIEDSDVNVNVIQPIKDEEEQIDDESVSFWQNGFTIGLHVSPLAMCLFTLLILAVLILRLALKIHKKRFEHKVACQSLDNDQKKKHHEFDDVSLQTVSTSR